MFMIFINFILSFIVLILPLFFFKKNKEIYQIESGFEVISKTSLKSFSMNFFYFLIIFIIFDLELFLIFPIFFKAGQYMIIYISVFIFLTLFFEWFTNKIIWMN